MIQSLTIKTGIDYKYMIIKKHSIVKMANFQPFLQCKKSHTLPGNI